MRLALIAGTSTPELARAIACALGRDLDPCTVERFPDGELGVVLPDVRGADVYLVQGTPPPAHDHLVELLLLADAARRAGAARVTGVMPYVAYARQDRRAAEGESIGARVVADQLSAALDRVVAVDLHTTTLEGFFSCLVEHLSAVPLLAERVRPLAAGRVVVAPDLGAAGRARRYAALLGLDTAAVRKRRLSGHAVEALGVDGDVRGRDVLIVDDMISTGATVAAAVNAVRGAGARRAIAVATHPLLVPPAEERLGSLDLDAIVVSDSVRTAACTRPPLDAVGLAPLLADAIRRMHEDAPLGEILAET